MRPSQWRRAAGLWLVAAGLCVARAQAEAGLKCTLRGTFTDPNGLLVRAPLAEAAPCEKGVDMGGRSLAYHRPTRRRPCL